MGYRQYLFEIEKDFANRISACKTNKEYCALASYITDKEAEEYDNLYFPPFNLGKELFEFGKYYENSEEMYKLGKPLFTSDELNELYDDYGVIIIGKDALLSAIRWQEAHICDLYKELADSDYINPYAPKQTQLQRLQAWVDDYLFYWEKFGVLDLKEDSEHLAHSWLYEHTIFDLVRIYKTFDWDNKIMLFLGW